jgi:hypothetical protein
MLEFQYLQCKWNRIKMCINMYMPYSGRKGMGYGVWCYPVVGGPYYPVK